jgi:hypothetical protein
MWKEEIRFFRRTIPAFLGVREQDSQTRGRIRRVFHELLVYYNAVVKGKRKVVSVLNYFSTTPRRRVRESRYISTNLDLGTKWRWVVSFTHRPLYHRRKRPYYALDRRLGGPQSWSGCCGEELLSLSGIELWPSSMIARRSPGLCGSCIWRWTKWNGDHGSYS